MTKGIVAAFDARRGIGYVQHTQGRNLVPFTARNVHGDVPAQGDAVEYTVVGGKAGVAAKQVRRILP